ncbi:MAG: hypothetical protein SF123_15810 [Chloroflexota bacterium]|nr:hypothetical protein [Chloroflexota bacterium]
MTTNNPLRALPSVDTRLQSQGAGALIARYGRGMTLDVLRTTLDEARPSRPVRDR